MSIDIVSELLKKQSSGVDLEALAGSLIDRFGGVDGLATQIFNEIEDCTPGSTSRAGLLRAIMDLVAKVTERSPPAALGAEMTDEDLKAAARQLIMDMQLENEAPQVEND